MSTSPPMTDSDMSLHATTSSRFCAKVACEHISQFVDMNTALRKQMKGRHLFQQLFNLGSPRQHLDPIQSIPILSKCPVATQCPGEEQIFGHGLLNSICTPLNVHICAEEEASLSEGRESHLPAAREGEGRSRHAGSKPVRGRGKPVEESKGRCLDHHSQKQ